MNIEELADSHLDDLLRATLEAHKEHIAVIEQALAGNEEARAVMRDYAKDVSRSLMGGTVQ